MRNESTTAAKMRAAFARLQKDEEAREKVKDEIRAKTVVLLREHKQRGQELGLRTSRINKWVKDFEEALLDLAGFPNTLHEYRKRGRPSKDEKVAYILALRAKGKNWRQVAEATTKRFNEVCTPDACRCLIKTPNRRQKPATTTGTKSK
jgi:hypothetical protein